MTTKDQESEPDLEVVRTMSASSAQIWAAWIDENSIARWWGPDGFTSTVHKLDVRAGGRFDVLMRSPQGMDFSNTYVFEEVEPRRRIVYIHQGSEEHGLAPSRSTVDIEQLDSQPPQTRVTLRAYYASAEDRRRQLDDFQAVAGARQLLERLERVALAGAHHQ